MNRWVSQPAGLSEAQREALAFASNAGLLHHADLSNRLNRILQGDSGTTDAFHAALDAIRSAARVVLHFHPDRFTRDRLTVAESLLSDGIYRNQYETGLSSGSRSAFAGGSRDRWERDLFGGVFHKPGVLPHERPKYGALELIRYSDGPLPRFGSCYFVLRKSVSQRSTYTFGGSEQPRAIERLGTVDNLLPVMTALLEEVANGCVTPVKWPPFVAPTLGLPQLTVAEFLSRVCEEMSADPIQRAASHVGRVLDSGVEAHVHGTISLGADVELLVVDPAFKDTGTGEALSTLATTFGVPLQWHRGYRLSIEKIPDDFRGPRMSPLAHRIARHGFIDAAVIGEAEATLLSTPNLWLDWGTPAETLQDLKQLWHVVVHFGETIQSHE